MGTRTPTQITGNVQGVVGNLTTMFDSSLVTLGWSIQETSGSARIYAPGAGGTGYCLYILDDGSVTGGAREAVVRMVEPTSTLASLVNPSPTVAQQSNNTSVIRKSGTLDTTNRPYVIVGDARFFALRIAHDGVVQPDCYFYGDLENGFTSDAYNCVVSQRGQANTSLGGAAFTNAFTSSGYGTASSNRFHTVRSIDGGVISDYAGIVGAATGWASGLGTYPHPLTNRLHYAQAGVVSSGSATLASSSSGGPRGLLPFVFDPFLSNNPSGIVVGDTWTDSAYDAGSLFLAVTANGSAWTAASSAIVLQTAGTWDPRAMLQL